MQSLAADAAPIEPPPAANKNVPLKIEAAHCGAGKCGACGNCSKGAGCACRKKARTARPMLSADDRAKLVASLRASYLKPPQDWPAPAVDPDVKWKELGLLPPPEFPKDNGFSDEKAELGKLLFFDPRLSSSRQIACASCHDPDLSWADGRTTAYGHERQPLARNTPSLLGAAYNKHSFWDGRASSLEEQIRAVILNPAEMYSTHEQVIAALNSVADYRDRFSKCFGSHEVTLENVAKAIATYERTLLPGRSRFDAFLRGSSQALSDEAVMGLHLFRTQARCMNCHHGPNFSDSQFHDVGLSYYGRELEDLGRYALTSAAEDVGRFKTPSLRNVSQTAPYMHNRLFQLEGVLNMYNAGMPTNKRTKNLSGAPAPLKSKHLEPLKLNRQDLGDLKAFLISLAEPRRRVRAPTLPR